MTVSQYIIGTELTRGIIQDKHTSVLACELSKLGYEIRRSVIVPDDGSVESSLRLGASDSDLLVVTGGLGPTSDDMTRSIIASLAGVDLVRNEQAWETLYKRVGERIYGANSQQTMIPEGFDIIPNDNGTAPGFTGKFEYDKHNVTVVCLPGPPFEMQPMLFKYVLPFLKKRLGIQDLKRDEYSVYLIAEAKLEELCKKVAQDNGIDDVEWGTRFQQFRVSLYLNGNNEASRKLFIGKLRELAGEALIADGDYEAVDVLTSCLTEKGMTISCAESCTSGLVAKTLTDKAGSSAWFWGGACTYDIDAKRKMLGISEDITDAVSERCAKEMAEGIRRISNSDIAVSVTGFAGPATDKDTHDVGTVFFGFASKNMPTQVVEMKISANSRDNTRRKFTTAVLVLAYLYVNGHKLIDSTCKWIYI